MKDYQLLQGESGTSLIEIMISSAIALITSLAIATLISSQQKQVKSLEQKLESLALEQSLQRLFADINACRCIFQNISFDGIPSGGGMSLNSINNGCFLGDTLIQANSLLPHSTTGLKVTTIELSNITDGPYRIDTLHFVPETSFTLFQTQKDHPLVQL